MGGPDSTPWDPTDGSRIGPRPTESALLELVLAGRSVREPLGDDALWKFRDDSRLPLGS